MAEFRFREKTKAKMVLELMEKVKNESDQEYPLHYYVDAAKDFDSLDGALQFLSKECPICYLRCAIHEVIVFLLSLISVPYSGLFSAGK